MLRAERGSMDALVVRPISFRDACAVCSEMPVEKRFTSNIESRIMQSPLK